jgi:predicted site-specific integrase-resolvase
MSPLKPLLTADEAVEMLAAEGFEVSAETLRRWARQGHLTVVRKGPGFGRGSRVLFQRNELRDLLKPATSAGVA